MAKKLLSYILSEPLNGAKTARFDIDTRDGNLTIDQLRSNEPLLASGTLQYFEKQGLPTRNLVSSDGQVTLNLNGNKTGQHWFHLPWATCNGATEWQIHINPGVPSEINAHSGGGNVKLNLVDMAITRVSADTGGGNMNVVLPAHTANLSVVARTGGGNVCIEFGSGITGNNILKAHSGAGDVVVWIPNEVAACIRATTGLGKTIMEPQFIKMDKTLYQSSDFGNAANQIEITLHSGAGNVIVNTK